MLFSATVPMSLQRLKKLLAEGTFIYLLNTSQEVSHKEKSKQTLPGNLGGFSIEASAVYVAYVT